MQQRSKIHVEQKPKQMYYQEWEKVKVVEQSGWKQWERITGGKRRLERTEKETMQLKKEDCEM